MGEENLSPEKDGSAFRVPLNLGGGGGGHQVWPRLNFFLVDFNEKSMTPHRGNTILFRSSQQLPRLRLGPLKGFLS